MLSLDEYTVRNPRGSGLILRSISDSLGLQSSSKTQTIDMDEAEIL